MKILETSRLTLSKVTLEDAPFLLKLFNDSEWLKFLNNKGVNTLEDARHHILTKLQKEYDDWGFGLFIVRDKRSENPLGICGLLKRDYLEQVDIGFGFLSDFCGMGYAEEAARGVMAYGKQELGLNQIVAIADKNNQKSINVLNKIGLTYDKEVEIPMDGSKIPLYT